MFHCQQMIEQLAPILLNNTRTLDVTVLWPALAPVLTGVLFVRTSNIPRCYDIWNVACHVVRATL